MTPSATFPIVAILLTITESVAAAPANGCVRVIQAWNETVDCQVTEQIEVLTWPDGFRGRDRRGKWTDLVLSGPCPKCIRITELARFASA